MVPISSLRRYIAGSTIGVVDKISVDTGDEATIDHDRRSITALLQRRHRGEEDFEVRAMREDVAGELEQLKKYVTAGLTLGVVALLAGGIGIMNVTLATIFARIKEIGIRRAVGASRADILAQFLIEAAWLGLAGGVAGLALGAVGVHLLESWGDRKVAAIAWYHGVGAVLLGGFVSAAFAFIPAYRASGLDPVEALRSE
jgi:putative ABC transport system permease protein